MQVKVIIGAKFAAVLANAFAQLQLADRFSLEATSALGQTVLLRSTRSAPKADAHANRLHTATRMPKAELCR